MLQAFVSLKPQQPSRTESGMRSFYEALTGAVLSQPTIYRTNADATVRPFTLDDIVESSLNPRCKFVVLRSEGEKFWQCTFLLPDKQGLGALFFDLQRVENPRRIAPQTLIEMFKKIYKVLKPRLIRIGDSEAREKLKSRHGLVMMPGLGRIEWLQIVSPELYAPTYNPSELVAAPSFAAEIWEDGAFFLRVYEDPNDWESEDNISLANFIPGFLAGVAKIQDSEKEKEALRDLERLWSRAERTAEKAYSVLDADSGAAAEPRAAAHQTAAIASQIGVDKPGPITTEITAEEAEMRDVLHMRLKNEYKLDDSSIRKHSVVGPCTIFEIHTSNKPVFFASYQDLDRKVYILNVLQDLSRFVAANRLKLELPAFEQIQALLRKYYRPDALMLDSIDDLPEHVRYDRRVEDLRKNFKTAKIEKINDNDTVTFWFYLPHIVGVETLTLTQFEDWPIQVESQIQCTDMENDPSMMPKEAVEEVAIVPEKTSTTATDLEQAEVATPKTEQAELVKVQGSVSVAKVIVAIIVIIIAVYLLLAYLSYGGDLMFYKHFLPQ